MVTLADQLRDILSRHEGERVLEVLLGRSPDFPDLDDRALAAKDLHDLSFELKAADGLGKAVVVSEHDDLAVPGYGIEDAGELGEEGGFGRGVDGHVCEGADGERVVGRKER